MKPLVPLELPLVGTQLIEASAGTGKTYTITSIVLRLLIERRLGVDQIAVVTFTKAATSELRERIRRRIDEAERAFSTGHAPDGDELLRGLLSRSTDRADALGRLRVAQRALDRASVFTIHGFAQRMLQEHAFESGARFDLELSADQRTRVTEVAHDFWAKEVATLPDEVWRLLEARRVRLASFVALGYVAAAWPELPLHGAVRASGDSAPEAACEALAAAWRHAVSAHRSGASEAFALLSPVKHHATRYSFEKIAAYREELETLLAGEVTAFRELPSALKYLRREAVTLVKKGHEPPEHPLFSAISALCEASERALQAGDELLNELRTRMVQFARERVTVEHEHAGTQSFDGLLQSLCVALRGKAGAALARRMRTRYPVALIDEFQDTDPTQYEIFRRVYVSERDAKGGDAPALFLIGDPKQAIYAFRGADVFAYLAAARDAADGAWTLSTNYRSDPSLLTALNVLFSRTERPFLLDGIRYAMVSAPEGRKDRLFREGAPLPPFELLYLDRATAGVDSPSWQGQREWTALAAHEIARLLASGACLEEAGRLRAVEPRDIAVLTRTNRQAQEIQDHLRQLRVPAVLAGDRTVFETEEAEELSRVMRALAEPSNASAVRTALATRFFGVSADVIARLADDEAAWETWVARFRAGHVLWTQSGFVHAIGRLMRELDVVAKTLAVLGGERRLTNLRHLVELLHGAEKSEHLGVVGLLQWFDEARRDPNSQGMAPEAQQLRLESDADAVTLTTMHKSKGLEYPIVVLPYLGAASEPFASEKENLRFHDPGDHERLVLDVRIVAHKTPELEIYEREYQAEALRLAYVGLTRAKHHVLAFWGGVGGAFSPLGYLLHQPAESLGGLEVDVATRLKNLDDAARLAELEQLAARSGGTLVVRRASLEPGPVLRPPAGAERSALRAERLGKRVPRGTKTSSFSAMTRGAHAVLSPEARAGRDVDEGEETPTTAEVDKRSSPGEALPLAEFPRGAGPGELLHAVFEHAPWEGNAEERRSVVEREVRRHGFDARHAPSLCRALDDVLATPLTDVSGDGAPWTLGEVPRAARVTEMEFVVPVSRANEGHLLTAERLARALSNAPEPAKSARQRSDRERAPWDAAYVERVARLEFQAWAGFLRGFIDLVFEREGRFYVLDYKSNYLGPHSDDYRPERLAEAMAEHHYYLQYLLYAVALHRYLGRRMADYDYERCFGGVYYLFVRGVQPSTGSSRGVFFHRPSRELVESLSALLDDPRGQDTLAESAGEAAL